MQPSTRPRKVEHRYTDNELDPESSERTPLVTPSSSDVEDADVPKKQDTTTGSLQLGFSWSFWSCIVLELLCELSTTILAVPMVSLLEQAICQRYYHHDHWTGLIDSDICRVPDIQRGLAQIRGWKAFFDTLPAIIIALPMGRIADRWSQRGVFTMTLVGMLAALTWILLVATHPMLPVRLILASSTFLLIGGGNYAAEMLLGVMVAKACNQETRTRGIYYYYSCFILSELIGPPIALWAVGVSLWLPFGISYTLLLLAFPLLAIMPKEKNKTSTDNQRTNVTVAESGDRLDPVMSLPRTLVHATVDQFRLLSTIFSNRNMCLAVPIFLVGTFRGISLRVLTQYTSYRFDWKLKQTNGLISEVALVNLFLFSLILPGIIGLINRYFKPTVEAVNLGVVKTSLSILCLGSLLLAFAPTSRFLIAATMIYALGFGARSTLLALVTCWIHPTTIGSLYSAVFLVEQIGMLFGEPLLHNLLGVAIGLEDPWKGLPFIGSALFFFVAFICAYLMRLRSS